MSLGDLFRGIFKATGVEAIGFEGSNAQSRWMGAVSGAAPTVGDYEVGDFVIDQTGGVWICTVAGSPGTWVKASGGGLVVVSPTAPSTPATGQLWYDTDAAC